MAMPTSGRRSPKSSMLDALDMAPPPTPAISVLSPVLVSLDRPSVLLKLAVGLFPWDPGGRRQLHRPLSKLPARGQAASQGRGRCYVGPTIPSHSTARGRAASQGRGRFYVGPTIPNHSAQDAARSAAIEVHAALINSN
jgi:hypothetical protein